VLDDAGHAMWRERLGGAWRIHLGVLVALWFAMGFLRPIGDPDLPRHLALGEWIVRHRAIPFVEPWAWTRPGAPFFAYSWLPELAQVWLWRALGETGLRVYNALLLTGAGLAILLVGRVGRWRPWTVILMALLHVGIASAVAGGQRPAVVLLTTVPLAWYAAYRLLDGERPTSPLLVLAAANVVAANSHILFPVMAAPLALLLSRSDVAWRRVALAGVATLGGWLLSPYALVWPEVFRLNFGANPLFAFPTPIAELTPGFTAAARLRDTLAIFAVALAVVPWVTAARLTTRERFFLGGLWVAGLTVFALAVRGVVLWWLVILPLAALAIEQLREPTKARVHRAQLVATYVVAMLFVLASVRADLRMRAARLVEGPRSLPAPANAWVEPAARWLECHAGLRARGRIFNSFDFGDYLVWRLPGYSVSLDGRNIFPDSVAEAEAFALAANGGAPLGPWKGADVALVPDVYPVAAVLDTARGWRRVLTSRPMTTSDVRIGLHVREEWWPSDAPGPLPDEPVDVSPRSGIPYECPHESDARR
jgi:hypothetical protein